MEIKEMLLKEPFKRGVSSFKIFDGTPVNPGEMKEASLPRTMYKVVSQDRFLKEYDPFSHDVLTDENIPTIVAKLQDNQYYEVKNIRMSLPYQKKIVEKQILYLCGKQKQFTLINPSPTDAEKALFSEIKASWLNKNMEQITAKLFENQKIVGDSALIHFFDEEGKYGCKVFSYKDGYVLLPKYDAFGRMEQFSLYYRDKDGKERLDIYDKENLVRCTLEKGNVVESSVYAHGFLEIPITYIRGDVAWDNSQSLIEVLEILYNIYTVIMKRHGWGMLYIKGNVEDRMKKVAGSVILKDSSPENNGDAKYLAAPTPEGMQNLLSDLHNRIQLMCGVVFLLPEDVRVGGDISGSAMKTMMSSAYERALTDAINYDEALDSVARLFIYGYGVENKKVTDVNMLTIRADFDIWFPQSDSDIINNIVSLKDRNLISTQTGTEISPYSSHDETERIKNEIKNDTFNKNPTI